MNLVFTYGTLKRGQPNNYLLENSENGKKRFIGDGKTVNKYPLVIASQFNIPFLLHEEGEGTNVSGQIYEVDDSMLSVLDDLEDHPNWYQRLKTQITLSESPEKQLECWCYFLTKYNPELLKLAYLESYDAYGEHGTQYVTPSERQTMDKETFIADVKGATKKQD